jgi:hypothetical protein
MKSKILAATALVSMMAVPTAAMAQTATFSSVSVSRQVLLDGGAIGSQLLRDETATLSTTGTVSATCALSWDGNRVDPTLAHLANENVSASATVTGTTTMRATRVNPQGMAIGQAIYEGSWTTPAATHNLSCPNGGSRTVPAVYGDPIPAVYGDPIPAVYGDPIPAVTEQQPEPVCKAFAQANPQDGFNVGRDCPKITVVITPAQPGALITPEQPGALITPAQPGPLITPEITYTYSYTLGQVSLAATGGTGRIDGVSFTFGN